MSLGEASSTPTSAELAAMIDHTVLAPDAAREDVLRLAQEAREHGFASVCVNGIWTETLARALAGSPVRTCVVVGFPLGASTTYAKVAETRDAMDHGAQEIDMVVSVADVRSGNRQAVEADVRAVAQAVHEQDGLLKVIIETCLLEDEQKVLACQAAVAAGADYVKTSTGFSTGGATVHDVELMRAAVGPEIGVKASGGIRTREDALAMVRAGASRIGASKGIEIIAEG